MVASKASKTDMAGMKAQAREYLASLPSDARKALRTVRKVILETVPTATEHFSYGVPGFRLEGQPLVWYAAFKSHFSLYPMGTAIRRTYASALKGYPMSTGTVRFPLGEPVPVALVTKLVLARAAEARAEAKKKVKR